MNSLPALLSELAATLGLMEHILMISHVAESQLMMLEEADPESHIFVKDAFANPDYLKYALAGTAASMLCYVIYVALNWPGISTAVTTCLLTARSNIGSSRQKRILRIDAGKMEWSILTSSSKIHEQAGFACATKPLLLRCEP